MRAHQSTIRKGPQPTKNIICFILGDNVHEIEAGAKIIPEKSSSG
jgi:hypothetical protein